MVEKNFLKDVYDDFFGIEKLTQENEKLRQELNIKYDAPAIEIKESKNVKMSQFFERIEKLHLKKESKNTLKKIIEYMRKCNEKIEKDHIQFNMIVYSKNEEMTRELAEIIGDAATFFEYVKRGKTIEVSLYNFEKVDQLNEIYNGENTIILLNDLEGLSSKEQDFKNKFWNNLESTISKNIGYINIIAAKNKEIINQVFNENEKIKETQFDFVIEEQEPDIQEIYQEVTEKLKENNKISDAVSIKILDYIKMTYQNQSLPSSEYRDKLCKTILFNKNGEITEADIPEYEKEKSTEEIFAELNSLVGLTKVKQVLNDLVSLIELKNKAQDKLKIKDTNLHMVFLGNPGTGKTTVARLVAQILYNLKYIKQNKLVEVSSKDLVAEYVGQTGPKTMAVVEKALGGVLFIDEAYSLASGNGQGNSYNEEAIATLIKAMEDYRDNLVVIFAGYTKEMQAFLNANSGIVSRIGYTLEFEDYTPNELLQIFNQMMQKAGFVVEQDAQDKVVEIINEYKDSKNFGNARFVRNVYEKSIIKHASNTQNKKSKKSLITITKEDICVDNLLKM